MYGDCPKGTMPTEDKSRCISNVECSSFMIGDFADFELTQDTTYLSVCNKIAIQKESFGEDCPPGTVEYTSGLCYAKCPSNLVENGFSCFKRSVARRRLRLCKNLLTWFDGEACTFNPLSFLIIFVSLGLFIISAINSSFKALA
jgi:hypothetical protein